MIKKFLNNFHCKSLLVLNGYLPESDFFSQITLPIIAIDGAAVKLAEKGIKPDLILGDLDSCPPDLFPSVERITTPDQNYSDFEKGLTYLEEKNLSPSLIIGISGGYLDHILYNFILLKKSGGIFYGENQIGFTIKDRISLTLPRGTKISLFGYPAGIVTSKGLNWELNNYSLDFFNKNSPCNRTKDETIKLEVKTGEILVIIYLIPIQDLGL
jgi:thiamine pyrophosphokinase